MEVRSSLSLLSPPIPLTFSLSPTLSTSSKTPIDSSNNRKTILSSPTSSFPSSDPSKTTVRTTCSKPTTLSKKPPSNFTFPPLFFSPSSSYCYLNCFNWVYFFPVFKLEPWSSVRLSRSFAIGNPRGLWKLCTSLFTILGFLRRR